MWPKKLIWQLYFSYLLIMGIPAIIITWYAADTFTRFYRTQMVEELKARAYIIGAQIEDHLSRSGIGNVDSLCKVLARKTPTRFTVIAANGMVIGDSERNPDSMENHGSRPEVITALSGKVGISERYSATLMEKMVYVALPAYRGASVAAVVRTSFPIEVIRAALRNLYSRIAAACGFHGPVRGAHKLPCVKEYKPAHSGNEARNVALCIRRFQRKASQSWIPGGAATGRGS